MIQCVESRNDEHPYCSRVCCSEAVKNALESSADCPRPRWWSWAGTSAPTASARCPSRRPARRACCSCATREERPRGQRGGRRLNVTVVDASSDRDSCCGPTCWCSPPASLRRPTTRCSPACCAAPSRRTASSWRRTQAAPGGSGQRGRVHLRPLPTRRGSWTRPSPRPGRGAGRAATVLSKTHPARSPGRWPRSIRPTAWPAPPA